MKVGQKTFLRPLPYEDPLIHKECQICGCGHDLIRDHDHKTKIIRGVLCMRCNSWIELLIKFPDAYYKKTLHAEWRKWVYGFAEKIAWYLSRDTGVLWGHKYQIQIDRNAAYHGGQMSRKDIEKWLGGG